MFYLLFILCAILASNQTFAGTLETVKARGVLHCGVSEGLIGFSNIEESKKQQAGKEIKVSRWTGLDVDFCRAVAAAVLGDSQKVKFFPSSASNRFVGLQEGQVDIVSHNATWTLTRDTSIGVQFVGVTYYDGQGVMVPRTLNVTSVTELDGAKICTDAGTTTIQNITDYFRSNNMGFNLISFESTAQVVAAYDAGQCDVYTSDKSSLAAQKLKLKKPAEHIILPEVLSKEPLGPYVRSDDVPWFNVVRWTLFALINAEELGITSTNIDTLRDSNNPVINRFVGKEARLGSKMGISDEWAYNITKQVGNYGEIFYKNIGPRTPLNLQRGMNALWIQGGLLYSPPIR